MTCWFSFNGKANQNQNKLIKLDLPLTPLRNVQHKPKHHLSYFIGAAGRSPVNLHSDGQHPLQLTHNPGARAQGTSEWKDLGRGFLKQKVPTHQCIPRAHCWVWRHTPLIPSLRKQRQGGLCKFKASLAYIVNFRPARVTW